MAMTQSGGYADYDLENQQLERRRKMAEMLAMNAQKPYGAGQMVGNVYVPTHWTQHAAQALNGYTADREMERLDARQKDIGVKYQRDLADTIRMANEARLGSPAKPEQAPLTPGDDEGNVNPNIPATPAVPGSVAKFAEIMMRHPATMPMGMQAQMDDMKRQQLVAALGGGQGGTAQGGTAPSGGAQPSGVGGAAGGVPMAAWLAADPSGKLYMEKLAEQNKPVPLREGDLVRPDANGVYGSVYSQPKLASGMQPVRGPNGQVTGAQAIPGYAEGAAQIASGEAGARAAAQAGQEMVTVNTPQGPRMMTKAQAVQMSGGNAPQSPWVGLEPIGEFQGDPAVIAQQINSIKDPADRAAAARAFNNQMSGLKTTGKTPGIALESPEQQKTQTVIAEGLGKAYNSIQESGFSANQKITKFARLGDTLNGLETGKLSPAGFEIAAYAKSLGFNINDKLPNAEAANALSREIALEMRNPSGGAGMPGAMSDADRNYLESMVAGLGKTPGANKMLVDGFMKLAERDKQVAQMARDYKKRKGNFDDGFYDELREYSESNPLFGKQPAAASGGKGWSIKPIP